MSQGIRKRIEEGFGWIKTVAGQRKTRFRGRERSVGVRLRGRRLQPGPPAQVARRPGVSVRGKGRIVELPGYADDYADMVEPTYILFETRRGEIAVGCVTGSNAGGAQTNEVAFNWSGNDEFDEASGEDGPNSSSTTRSRATSASRSAITSSSSPVSRRLLNQPVIGEKR